MPLPDRFGGWPVVMLIGHRLAMRGLHGRGRCRQDDQQQILHIAGQVGIGQDAVALDRAEIADRQQFGEFAPTAPRRGIGDDVRGAIGKDQPRADDEAQVGVAGSFLRLAEFERQARFLLCFEQRRAGVVRCPLARHMRAHDSRHRVAIGNAKARQPQRHRLRHHVGGMGRAAQEGEIGRRHQFGEGRRIGWRRMGRGALPARLSLHSAPWVSRFGFGRVWPLAATVHANRPWRYQPGSGVSAP